MRNEKRSDYPRRLLLRLINLSLIIPIRPFLIALTIVVLSQLVLGPSEIWAGPPHFTDDPEPADYKHGEFYIVSQYQHARDGNAATLPHFEFNYGVLPNVHLHVITPFQYAKPEGEAAQYGFGDLEFGIKFRFIQESDYIPMVGTFPIALFPTGDKDKGLGSGETQVFLPLWFQKSWGPWTTYGGGGYWINPGEGNKDWWFFGWLLQREISEQLTVGTELFHRTISHEGGESSTGFNVGAVINITENHHILLSAGRDFDGPNLFTSYIGYQFTFGPKEAKKEAKNSFKRISLGMQSMRAE
jgi:Putative MetA-pathway of phenol degradation